MIKDIIQEAFILKNQGFYKHAIETLYKALELDNVSIELLFEIADLYFLLKDEERALNYLEQILDKNPTHIDSLKLLKSIFISKEAWKEAEQTAKNIYCITKNTNDLSEIFKILNKQGYYTEIFEYEIKSFNENVLYEKSFAKFQTNEFDDALFYINQALDLKPDNTDFNILKGEILLKQNNDNEALNILHNLKIQPDCFKLLNFAGIVYQRNGLYKEALEAFSKALKCNEQNDSCYYNCASTYFKMGDIIQAKKYYNLAISKNPNNQSYHLALANLYYAEKNYKRALEELKDFNFYEAKLLKSIILADAGYIAIAKKEFENLNQDFPEDIVVKEYIEKINSQLKI